MPIDVKIVQRVASAFLCTFGRQPKQSLPTPT